MQEELFKFAKQKLFSLCQEYVENRIATAQQAIKSAQESANQDSKSSMGDKYETSRAMAQLEIEKNTTQLAEAMKLKSHLESIPREQTGKQVKNGSLVQTNDGYYFISISAGKLEVDGKHYFAISAVSPLGSCLLNKSENEEYIFNGRKILITKVY